MLGVLVEKELTTPEQYPLTLNAATNGANQKNNRDPVVAWPDTVVEDALEGLREKGLVVRVDTHGSRVPKYRQEATAKLALDRYELILMAELMLRGPQTLGELRGRASRMHHLDSIEFVRETLEKLAARPEPLVRRLPPSPGSRAERYVQLLCPDAHPIDVPASATSDAASPAPVPPAPSGPPLADRVAALEAKVDALTAALRNLATSLGEGDPLAGPGPQGPSA